MTIIFGFVIALAAIFTLQLITRAINRKFGPILNFKYIHFGAFVILLPVVVALAHKLSAFFGFEP